MLISITGNHSELKRIEMFRSRNNGVFLEDLDQHVEDSGEVSWQFERKQSVRSATLYLVHQAQLPTSKQRSDN